MSNTTIEEAIAALLATYPPGQEIPARAPGQITEASAQLDRLPGDARKRRIKLLERIKQVKACLAGEIERYDNFLRRGLDAVSASDLSICYSGDAFKACKGTITLLHNHVSYSVSILCLLEAELTRLDGATASAIPVGFVAVDVVLPAHQAFIVRKWAKAAEQRMAEAHAKTRAPGRSSKVKNAMTRATGSDQLQPLTDTKAVKSDD
jgi:hypothetical protein